MERQVSIGLQTRRATVEASTINEENRTFEAIWSTGAMVMRYDWFKDELFMEELALDESAVRMDRLNGGAPFLDSHDSFSLRAVLGSVQRAWLTKDDGRAIVRIDKGDENADYVWGKIRQGSVRNISVGYRIYELEEDERGYSMKGKKKPLRLMRAIDWEPFEISAVAVGADAGAKIRQQQENSICTVRMIDSIAEPQTIGDEIVKAGATMKTLADGMRFEFNLNPQDCSEETLAAAIADLESVRRQKAALPNFGVLRARLALLKA